MSDLEALINGAIIAETEMHVEFYANGKKWILSMRPTGEDDR